MKVKYSNLLTKLAGIVGVTGISLLIGLPTGANEVLNPNPGIFKEAPYNGGQRLLINAQHTQPSDAAPEVTKSKKTPDQSITVAQKGGGLNPNPKILQECPYNRAACPGGGGTSTPPASTPESAPTTPGTEIPTTPGAPGTETPSKEPAAGTENKNVVAIAQSNNSLTFLTKALKAAGLAETLQGKGPFTIFAPNDAAFGKLPPDAVQDLLKPENKEVLVKILRYHVVQGSVTSSDLKSGEVKSIEGQPIIVKVDPSAGVAVNDGKVVQPDIKASNGVIHVIDTVILPPDL